MRVVGSSSTLIGGPVLALVVSAIAILLRRITGIATVAWIAVTSAIRIVWVVVSAHHVGVVVLLLLS